MMLLAVQVYYEGLSILLTLHVPATPDDIVQANFVLPPKSYSFEMIPFG